MEEGIKNRIILILGIFCLLLFMVTLRSCADARKFKDAKDKETITRFELEDKINKFMQEKAATEQKLSNLSKEMEEEKAAHQVSKTKLQEEQQITENLREELEKVTKLKETLEEDLKEALVTDKSSKSKK